MKTLLVTLYYLLCTAAMVVCIATVIGWEDFR